MRRHVADARRRHAADQHGEGAGHDHVRRAHAGAHVADPRGRQAADQDGRHARAAGWVHRHAGTSTVTIGQICMSVTRAAGGIAIVLSNRIGGSHLGLAEAADQPHEKIVHLVVVVNMVVGFRRRQPARGSRRRAGSPAGGPAADACKASLVPPSRMTRWPSKPRAGPRGEGTTNTWCSTPPAKKPAASGSARIRRPPDDLQIRRELQPVADVVEAADDHGFSFFALSASFAMSSVGMSSSNFLKPSSSLSTLSLGLQADSMISRLDCSSSLQAW